MQADEAREQSSRRGEDQDDETGRKTRRPASPTIFSPCARSGRVAGEAFEQKRLRVLEAGEERRAEEPGHEPDQRGVQQGSSQDAQVERGSDRAQRRRERRGPARALVVRRSSAGEASSAGGGGVLMLDEAQSIGDELTCFSSGLRAASPASAA